MGIKLAIQLTSRGEGGRTFRIVHQDETILRRNSFDARHGAFRIRSAAVPDISGLTFYVRGHQREDDNRPCIITEHYWPDLVQSLIIFNSNYTHNTLTEEDVVWQD
jgi:hypothetical protein